MKTRDEIKKLAKRFIKVADKYNNGVSNYLDGSNEKADIDAYIKVKSYYRDFINAYNEYYEDNFDDSLNYELVFSIL